MVLACWLVASVDYEINEASKVGSFVLENETGDGVIDVDIANDGEEDGDVNDTTIRG